MYSGYHCILLFSLSLYSNVFWISLYFQDETEELESMDKFQLAIIQNKLLGRENKTFKYGRSNIRHPGQIPGLQFKIKHLCWLNKLFNI